MASPGFKWPKCDFSALSAIHFHLFQDLYEWAGSPRSYGIRKGGDEFAPAEELPRLEKTIFEPAESFRSIAAPRIAEMPSHFARMLSLINFFHPFPEGNGRAQRVFLHLLAKSAGYSISWEKVQGWEMKEVCRRAYENDLDPMVAMFQRIIH